MTPPAADRAGMYTADIEDIRRRFDVVTEGLDEDLRMSRELARALPGLVQKGEATLGAAEKIGEATVAACIRIEQLTRRTEELAGLITPLVSLIGERDERVVEKIGALLDAKLAAAAQQKGQGRGPEVVAQITSRIDTSANALAAGQADLGAKFETAVGELKKQLAELGRRAQQDDRQRPATGEQEKGTPAASLHQRVDGVISRLNKNVKERSKTEQGRRLFLVGRVWIVELPEQGGQQKQPSREALSATVVEAEQKRKKGEVSVVVVSEAAVAMVAADGKLAEEAARMRVFITGVGTLESFVRAANTGATDGAQGGARADALEQIRTLIIEAGRDLRELPNTESIRAKLLRAVSLTGANKESAAGGVGGAGAEKSKAGAQAAPQAEVKTGAGKLAGADTGEATPDAATAATGSGTNGSAEAAQPAIVEEPASVSEGGGRLEQPSPEQQVADSPAESKVGAKPAAVVAVGGTDASDSKTLQGDGARKESPPAQPARETEQRGARPQTAGGACAPCAPPALRSIGRKSWSDSDGQDGQSGGQLPTVKAAEAVEAVGT